MARLTGRTLDFLRGRGALREEAFFLDPVFARWVSTFLSWHAFRHSLLISQQLFGPPSRTNPVNALLQMHLRCWPLYLPVIPVMALLIWLNGNLSNPEDWVASLLVICVVFTLPHHFIVERWLSGSNIA